MTIELSGGVEFGRCGNCGGRTSAERVKAGKSCWMCDQGYGPPRVRRGVRFRTVDGKVTVVVERMPERLVIAGARERAGEE